MSDTNQKPRKFVLDKWFEINFIRFMRGLEPLPPTFSVMPPEIIDQVVEKMEPIDRLRARKVCRSLRSAVDKFGLLFGCISLRLMKDEVEIRMNGTKIIYSTAENGNSIVNCNGQESIIDGENFVQRATKDLKILSKHARKVRIWNETKDRRDIFTTFTEFLGTKKCILVEELELWGFSLDEILTILLFFDAKGLKNIELSSAASFDRFEQITNLEQWENAEESEIFMQNFYTQTAIQMRDDLLRRSTFQSCDIYFEKSKTNPIEIAKVFEPDYAGGNEFNIEYSNANHKFAISLEYCNIDPNHFLLKVKRL